MLKQISQFQYFFLSSLQGYIYIILRVFLSFSVTVMKQDNESNRRRDEGKEESSCGHNRAKKTFFFIFYTRLRWTARGLTWESVCFGDLGRLTMFGIGYACFITWSRPFGCSFSIYCFFSSPFFRLYFVTGR